MEDVLTGNKLSIAQQNMQAYFETHDVQYVTEDAVFINMATGEKTHGRKAIGEMLQYIYHVAFNAQADFTNTIVTEDKAMVEGYFKGKHTGEFAGMQATNKEVNVPLCVTYKLENGLIKEAHIYMLGDVLMQQLNQ